MGGALGVAHGHSLDLNTRDPDDGHPWDFRLPSKRAKARQLLQTLQPWLLVTSPPCTMFSQVQHTNWHRMDPEMVRRRMIEARLHLDFCMELCHLQAEQGRLFLHEHPWSASSWAEPSVAALLGRPGAIVVKADLCQFGLETVNQGMRGPAKKATGFVTNSVEMAKELDKTCPGIHQHVTIMGGSRTKQAQIYPPDLCRAICNGAYREQQLRSNGIIPIGMVDISNYSQDAKDTEAYEGTYEQEEEPEDDNAEAMQVHTGGEFRDAVTGKALPTHLVKKARAEEVAFFRSKPVYQKVPRAQCFARTGKPPIRVKWVDVNKGDEVQPEIRSRLVAMEFNTGQRSEHWWAGTPPLEALRLLLSDWASQAGPAGPGVQGKVPDKDECLLVLDVRKAHLEAMASREVYVELPEEDWSEDEPDSCGLLLRSMYGTRDAAANWARCVEEKMGSLGFEVGKFSPCLFQHAGRHLRALCHGDDFVVRGSRAQLAWFEKEMRARFNVKTKLMGPRSGDVTSAQVLGRVVTLDQEGVLYEADPRHAEVVVESLGLEWAKDIGSPGCKETTKAAEENRDDMAPDDARAYRAIVARLNYLAADRPDIQYSVKEACRVMSTPKVGDWLRVKRIGRFLRGRMRLTWRFAWQTPGQRVYGFTDTDFAGCLRTRRSTSCGLIMVGAHLVRAYSKTQGCVSLSSGEAELAGIVKGSSEMLGVGSIMRDLGLNDGNQGILYSDASAALGIVQRKGAGNVRHLDTRLLWVQDVRRNGQLEYGKVSGEHNPADMGTKFLGVDDLEHHMGMIRLRWQPGRPAAAPGSTSWGPQPSECQ